MAIDTAPTGSGTRSAHPLDALSAKEIEAAADVLRADGRLADAALFAYFGLDEPSKETVAGFTAGDPVDRRVRVVLVPGPAADVVEAVVDVGRRAVLSWLDTTIRSGRRPSPAAASPI
jgi:primary-amine oxidase